MTQARWAGGDSHRPFFSACTFEAPSRLANDPEAELFLVLFAAAREKRGVEMVD